MTRALLFFLALAAGLPARSLAAAAPCLAVEEDRLLARSLVSVWPAFRQLPGEISFGYTPVPGVRRFFHPAELERLAARYQVAPPPSGFCVERAMESLDRARLEAAMRAGLDLPEARIEILEFSRFPVPRGELRFPRAGLPSPGPSPAPCPALLWKGYVQYSGGRRFPVWARVRVSAALRRVVALEDLPASLPVRESQVRLESGEAFPFGRAGVRSLEEVVGRVPRRAIASGTVITPALLEEPRDVNRGDTVEIRVETGAARLSFHGRAETAGRVGETVSIRNLTSGKAFSARVEDKGRVRVDLPPPPNVRSASSQRSSQP
ncbi:MAG TPA: flagellar basal body P-ring formation chaperone FlgA [Bryobacteraceae bacterium]|nr:flagellar basal body P-ring formation chaperone FlgA [Bryobacteraceae bacterium]